MDRDSAEKYVNYGGIVVTKKTCIGISLFNIVLCICSANIYTQKLFKILCYVCVSINLINLILTVLLKLNLFRGFLIFSIASILLVIAINIICFATYKFNNVFVLWEYLLNLIIQIASLLPIYLSIKFMAKKIMSKKNIALISSSIIVAPVCYSVYLFLKYYLSSKNISVRMVMIILNFCSLFINLTLIFLIVGFLYKASLIKRFNL